MWLNMWFKWWLIAFFVLDAALYATLTNREPKVVTGGDVARRIVVTALIITGICYYWR